VKLAFIGPPLVPSWDSKEGSVFSPVASIWRHTTLTLVPQMDPSRRCHAGGSEPGSLPRRHYARPLRCR